jgi:5'-nucleotidase / UDP-sugar diphosphatase
MMEQSVSGARGEGRFLQVSGLRVRFDRSRPEGERVLHVQIQQGDGWAPLDDDTLYSVAVPDFLQGGGDGYTFHLTAERSLPPGPELRLVAFDVLTSALSRGESIAPRVEGRLTEVAAGVSPP